MTISVVRPVRTGLRFCGHLIRMWFTADGCFQKGHEPNLTLHRRRGASYGIVPNAVPHPRNARMRPQPPLLTGASSSLRPPKPLTGGINDDALVAAWHSSDSLRALSEQLNVAQHWL